MSVCETEDRRFKSSRDRFCTSLRSVVDRLCEYCGGAFQAKPHQVKGGGGRFCSRRCGATVSNQARRLPAQVCAWCHQEFWRRNSTKNASKSGLRFCSRACLAQAKKSHTGLASVRPAHYGTSPRPKYRTKVKRDACTDCGWSVHPGVLQVHHIDCNERNNKVENLVVLCPTCHEVRHLLSSTGRWRKRARVAQIGERPPENREVVGAIPTASTEGA